MLTIKRKAGETVWIGNETCITLLAIHPRHVTLGIDAPDEVTLLRGELFNRLTPAERKYRDEIAMSRRIAKRKGE